MFNIELIWNRENHWVGFGDPEKNLDKAIKRAEALRDSGDADRDWETLLFLFILSILTSF